MGEVKQSPGVRMASPVATAGWIPANKAPDHTPMLAWDASKPHIVVAVRITSGSPVWVIKPGGYLCRPSHCMPLPEPPK